MTAFYKAAGILAACCAAGSIVAGVYVAAIIFIVTCALACLGLVWRQE